MLSLRRESLVAERAATPAGPVSGGSRGAAVRLDAVLAEQVAQAIELTVHPLVLRDNGPDIYTGCPRVLQPQLLGAQLLFPSAQRRGALVVARLERGCLLPLRLAELLGDVGKAGGDGEADQPRFRICLLVPAGQQSHHPFLDQVIAGAPAGQHLSGNVVASGEQAQQ